MVDVWAKVRRLLYKLYGALVVQLNYEESTLTNDHSESEYLLKHMRSMLATIDTKWAMEMEKDLDHMMKYYDELFASRYIESVNIAK